MGGSAARLKDELGIGGSHGDRLGHGPHPGEPFPGDGHHDVMGVWPARAQLSVACAEPYGCLPADLLSGGGARLSAPWQVATDVRGIAGRPGAIDACASRLGVPRLGERALTPPRTAGVCCGGQAHVTQARSGVVNARPIPPFRDEGDDHGAWHAPQGLTGLDHRRQTPGVHRLVACVVETRQACGGLVPRPDLGLEDEGRRRGGTDHVRAPAPVGGAPRGPPRVATLGSEEARVETARDGLETTEGIVTRPGEVANGISVDRGHRHRRASTGAPEPRPWHGITAVGVHAVARLVRHHGRGHDPARLACCGQVARAPGPPGPCFLDTDERLGLGWERADAVIEVTRTRAHGPQRGDLSPVIVSDRRHRDGLLMNIQTVVKRARLAHG